MNSQIISREEILKTCRELIRERGVSLQIRAVAERCGVSVGTIYNYYPSKASLTSAAVGSVWSEIFHHGQGDSPYQDTLDCIRWIYKKMEYGSQQYPGFFTLHALGFLREEKEGGTALMRQAWQHIQDGLAQVLRQDEKIRPGAFTPGLSVETMAGLLFSLMLSAFLRRNYDPAPVLELVRRTLYEPTETK